jgi:hypothetical protein
VGGHTRTQTEATCVGLQAPSRLHILVISVTRTGEVVLPLLGILLGPTERGNGGSRRARAVATETVPAIDLAASRIRHSSTQC